MTSWPATHDTKTTIICSSNLTWPATHKNHQGSPHVHVTWHHRQRTKTIKNPACSCKWHHRQHTMTTAPLKAHLSWPHHTMSSLAHNVIGTHTHTHTHNVMLMWRADKAAQQLTSFQKCPTVVGPGGERTSGGRAETYEGGVSARVEFGTAKYDGASRCISKRFVGNI